MNNIYYKILFLLLMSPLLVTGNNSGKMKGKYTKEKSLNKEFSVDKDALLKINNDYGNLDITAWNENRVVMEITIKVNGDDEERVIEKLKDINVVFESTSQMVSAKTTFSKDGKSWWNKLTDSWGNSNMKMEINYTVKVPITNRVDLNNDYGSITLDKIEGQASINCDYGQIIIGELLGMNNYINIDYTRNSTIQYMNNGKINADYSNFTLKKGENIDLNADYTKSKFITIKELTYNCDYGALYVENGNSIRGNGDYINTDIGSVSKELTINSDYGSIEINSLQPSTKNVKITADYTGVSIGYKPSCNFDFTIKTSYGGIKLDERINVLKKSKHNTSKDYEGYHGEKNSGNTISINSSYGGVKLRQN